MTKLREIESFAPNDPVILAELGWFFATQPDSTMRNGAEAVRLAERASDLDLRSFKRVQIAGEPQPRIVRGEAAAGRVIRQRQLLLEVNAGAQR